MVLLEFLINLHFNYRIWR